MGIQLLHHSMRSSTWGSTVCNCRDFARRRRSPDGCRLAFTGYMAQSPSCVGVYDEHARAVPPSATLIARFSHVLFQRRPSIVQANDGPANLIPISGTRRKPRPWNIRRPHLAPHVLGTLGEIGVGVTGQGDSDVPRYLSERFMLDPLQIWAQWPRSWQKSGAPLLVPGREEFRVKKKES